MTYKVEAIDTETIELVGKTVTKLDIDNVVIVQAPLELHEEIPAFLKQLREVFPEKELIVTTSEVKFCKLVDEK